MRLALDDEQALISRHVGKPLFGAGGPLDAQVHRICLAQTQPDTQRVRSERPSTANGAANLPARLGGRCDLGADGRARRLAAHESHSKIVFLKAWVFEQRVEVAIARIRPAGLLEHVEIAIAIKVGKGNSMPFSVDDQNGRPS